VAAFLQVRCPSCHLTNNIKELEGWSPEWWYHNNNNNNKLEVIFNEMRYTNLRFTYFYLFTYLLISSNYFIT